MPIYMQINGINGNVTTKGHEKWIELNSMQFGVGWETNRETSTTFIPVVQISKLMDETSPLLFI